jgi:predicted ATPase
MIEKIRIENFKSIQSLELELGRVNVFIGENGSGKTNILEAIGICSAAFNRKLDGDFLSSIGLRYTNAVEYKSGFNSEDINDNIIISIEENNHIIGYSLNNLEGNLIINNSKGEIGDQLIKSIIKKIVEKGNATNADFEEVYALQNPQLSKKVLNSKELLNIVIDDKKVTLDIVSSLEEVLSLREKLNSETNSLLKDKKTPIFSKFAIYCPENTYLRRTDEESHLKPIGIKGEGLLNFLSDLLEKEPDSFDAIKEQLQILNWFEDFDIKTNFLTGGKSMVLKDRFLKEGIKTISLKNANEGFLFVLFYITLFSSEKTPQFFAIDNFDNALNPKLCRELIKILTKIAKEKGKQVILTTHNPAVLDGLDLNDEEQRLFTVSRSHKTGETKIKRIVKKATPFGETPVRLSEKFMNGSIGGLPKNF